MFSARWRWAPGTGGKVEARRREAAFAAGDPAAARERGRLDRSPGRRSCGGARRRALSPRASRSTSRGCARPGGGRDRHSCARLRPAVEPAELDLALFERLVGEAGGAAPGRGGEARGRRSRSGAGRPLADLAYEPFAQAEIARLEELRLAAWSSGSRPTCARRPRELVAELETLVVRHPLRERLRCQLMLALYRTARQAERWMFTARPARASEGLGIEPSGAEAARGGDPPPGPALDCRPDGAGGRSRDPRRSARSWSSRGRPRPSTARSASRGRSRRRTAARAHRRRRRRAGRAGRATAALAEHRDQRSRTGSRAGPRPSPRRRRARTSCGSRRRRASTCCSWTRDRRRSGRRGRGARAGAVRRRPAVRGGRPLREGPVVVPFGGAEHDWAALELGAWVARATARRCG